MKALTDHKFWEKYWSHKGEVKVVGKTYPFHDLFEKYVQNSDSMIEIGGYPGYFAIYFHKFRKSISTLLDFFIHEPYLKKVWHKNGIGKGEVEVIKTDFFKFKTRKQYDLVFSLGFLEHFDDTEDVILRHWQLVKKGGTMLIVLPNFLGLNGLIQFIFDSDNLNKHNLESMNIGRLQKILISKKIKGEVFYWGGLRVWLENLGQRSVFHKILVYGLCGLGLIVKAFGINNKFLSPYIVIYAKKS